MKATIDLPETLFRQTKIRAATEGSTVRELVIRALERELSQPSSAPLEYRAPFPLVTLPPGTHVKSLTNSEIDELLA